MNQHQVTRLLEIVEANTKPERQQSEPPLRLPFNGTLSTDELRMLKQGIFDDYDYTQQPYSEVIEEPAKPARRRKKVAP